MDEPARCVLAYRLPEDARINIRGCISIVNERRGCPAALTPGARSLSANWNSGYWRAAGVAIRRSPAARNLRAADGNWRLWQCRAASHSPQNMVDSGGIRVVFSGERAAARAVILGVLAAYARLVFGANPARLQPPPRPIELAIYGGLQPVG